MFRLLRYTCILRDKMKNRAFFHYFEIDHRLPTKLRYPQLELLIAPLDISKFQ